MLFRSALDGQREVLHRVGRGSGSRYHDNGGSGQARGVETPELPYPAGWYALALASELLFEVVTRRYEHGSILLTTNLGVGRGRNSRVNQFEARSEVGVPVRLTVREEAGDTPASPVMFPIPPCPPPSSGSTAPQARGAAWSPSTPAAGAAGRSLRCSCLRSG